VLSTPHSFGTHLSALHSHKTPPPALSLPHPISFTLLTRKEKERSKAREDRRKEKKKKGRRGQEDGAHPLMLEDVGNQLHHLHALDVAGVGGDRAPSTFFNLKHGGRPKLDLLPCCVPGRAALLEVTQDMVSTSPKSLTIFPTSHGHSQKLPLSSMATTTMDGVELHNHHAWHIHHM
jgi:hypothetical protein